MANEYRDRRIMKLYEKGVIRKQIAMRVKMEYGAVVKVIKKHTACSTSLEGKAIVLSSFQ